MKRFLAIIAVLVMMAAPSFALSDSEYLRMKKNNADFARADRRLTQVWKNLKNSLPRRVFAELQDLQNDWIFGGRDDAAESYMNDGYSRVEAYTMATSDRADALPDIADDLARRMRRR